jgi:hypothetical protein
LPGGGIDCGTVTIQHICNAHAHAHANAHVHVHAYGIASERIPVTRGLRGQLNRTDTTTDAEFASNRVRPGRALHRGVPERRP